MIRGVFVTGTDTDVGKTVVSALIARGLRAQGTVVAALKPFATGASGPGSDAEQLGEAAGHEPRVFQSFATPAAPERAAREAGAVVDVAGAIRWVLAHPGVLVVEGVGGVEVPLDATHRVSDFARALALPVVVVARNRLGALSHTLLTVDAVVRAGLTVRAVVLNDAADSGPLLDWNAADLAPRVPNLFRLGAVTPENARDWSQSLVSQCFFPPPLAGEE
jgi:dethiobiotin synthetase